jgi:hypothetical protein
VAASEAEQADLGALLGALLRAEDAALRTLDVRNCSLGDAGLRALAAALAANTTLTALDCAENGVSGACARDALLPAARANESLRELEACDDEASEDEEEEEEQQLQAEARRRYNCYARTAEALVAARST